ncbi:MAG: biotin--[acetyl-CoA-carboxylase] ligase [Thermoleophilaceae bacterium]
MTVGGALGLPRAHHRLTDSTNERAKALAALGAPHGTLVTAEEQTAGRGRQGRSWSAPAGKALLCSLLARGLEPRDALLPLAAAVAACEASEAVAHVEARIKWPNDVWIEGRKLAGILIEGRPQEGWAVVGIGLNVGTVVEEFPEELRDTATSLAVAGGSASPPSVEVVLGALLEALRERLGNEEGEVLTAWRERDALLGSRVRWAEGEGEAAGIDHSGALLVDTVGGRLALDAGEVHLLR